MAMFKTSNWLNWFSVICPFIVVLAACKEDDDLAFELPYAVATLELITPNDTHNYTFESFTTAGRNGVTFDDSGNKLGMVMESTNLSAQFDISSGFYYSLFEIITRQNSLGTGTFSIVPGGQNPGDAYVSVRIDNLRFIAISGKISIQSCIEEMNAYYDAYDYKGTFEGEFYYQANPSLTATISGTWDINM